RAVPSGTKLMVTSSGWTQALPVAEYRTTRSSRCSSRGDWVFRGAGLLLVETNRERMRDDTFMAKVLLRQTLADQLLQRNAAPEGTHSAAWQPWRHAVAVGPWLCVAAFRRVCRFEDQWEAAWGSEGRILGGGRWPRGLPGGSRK